MIAKSLVGLSALISAGIVVGTDPAARPHAAAPFAERFPTFEELMLQPTALAAPKAARQAVSHPTGCERQTWPYIGSDCLTSLDGSPVRRPARTITIERRFDNGSILVQAELAEMVSR